MRIESSFDGGNIELIKIDLFSNDVQLNIRKDINADFKQVFYFQALDVKDLACSYRVIDAAEVAYPDAWLGMTVLVSYDGDDWFRIPANFDKKEFSFSFTAKQSNVFFSIFTPYSEKRHQQTITKTLDNENCQLHKVIKSVQGRDVEILRFGKPSTNKPKLWIIARQHPAEAMAEWYTEGLLNRLCTGKDQATQTLLEQAEIYIVPNINPDGSFAGNIRTNAGGLDLNRAWAEPSVEKSPEVYFMLEEMEKVGVDFFLDVHGEEEMNYVFPCGSEGNPGYTDKIAALEAKFYQQYEQNSEFQSEHKYPLEAFGTADLSIANNHVGQRFDCLSLALEMPFKDNDNQKEPIRGWSSARSMTLGAELVEPLLAVINEL